MGRRVERGQGVRSVRPQGRPGIGRALCSRADVVLEGFRPGVAERLGSGPPTLPESVVYCSLTGFGATARMQRRAGHDLNYLGYAGVLADTAPALPPVQIADLATGALGGRESRSWPPSSSGSAAAADGTSDFDDTRGTPLRRSPARRRARPAAPHRRAERATGSTRRRTAVGSPSQHLEPKFCPRLAELLDLAGRVDRRSRRSPHASDRGRSPNGWSSWRARTWRRGRWRHSRRRRETSATSRRPACAPALGEHTEAWRRELGAN